MICIFSGLRKKKLFFPKPFSTRRLLGEVCQPNFREQLGSESCVICENVARIQFKMCSVLLSTQDVFYIMGLQPLAEVADKRNADQVDVQEKELL